MLIKGVNFKLGADPELFVKRKGKFISGHGMIPGDKDNPHKVDGGAVQVDGMALEFNIDPVESAVEWENNLLKVMRNMRQLVPEGNTLSVKPTADFGLEYIRNQPEEARRLGCDPDMNAYTGMPNPAPDGDVDFRTAAGHIHIGWGEDMDINDPSHKEACIRLVKHLDLHLGLSSILVDRDVKRRELYGKAGCYRPKPYGVEYRTLSNFWLRNRKLRFRAFDLTKKAILASFKGEVRHATSQMVTSAINDDNLPVAYTLSAVHRTRWDNV